MVISRAQQYLLENTLSLAPCDGKSLFRLHVQCVSIVVLQPLLCLKISQRKLLNNVYCLVVVFSLQFKQLQRVVTMALNPLPLYAKFKNSTLSVASVLEVKIIHIKIV